jgi:hypothetical protein
MKLGSPLPFVYVGMYQAVSVSSATWSFLLSNHALAPFQFRFTRLVIITKGALAPSLLQPKGARIDTRIFSFSTVIRIVAFPAPNGFVAIETIQRKQLVRQRLWIALALTLPWEFTLDTIRFMKASGG